MSKAHVYLDHNATTPLSGEIRDRIGAWIEAWGNPSSIHQAGRGPKQILREARAQWARVLNCSPLELVFTSGATESNNAVLKSAWTLLGAQKNHFVISAVEHPSLQRAVDSLVALGARVDRVPVSREGFLDLAALENLVTEKTALVSVMAANNETGNLFPIHEVVRIAHARGALVHTDAVQMLGKASIDLHSWGVDYASFSAHKFYALKGTGALYIAKGRPFLPLIDGGGQERHRRGGTENVLGIAAFGHMASRASEIEAQAERLRGLRDRFEERVREEIPGVSITGAQAPRLANTSSLILPGVDGETMLMSLDLKGFAVSTGAACSSGNPEPSPVLLAMGLSRGDAQNSLRVSLGWGTTDVQINDFVEALKQTVFRLRALETPTRELTC